MSFAGTRPKVSCAEPSERGRKKGKNDTLNGRKRNWKDYDENKGEEKEERF